MHIYTYASYTGRHVYTIHTNLDMLEKEKFGIIFTKTLNQPSEKLILESQCSVATWRGGMGWKWEGGSGLGGHTYTYG